MPASLAITTTARATGAGTRTRSATARMQTSALAIPETERSPRSCPSKYSRFDHGPVLGNQADPSTAIPSSGLSANFIRGSKFTVTAERAALGFIRAYMDGLGGAAGSQQVQVLVYDNSPGHKLVAESSINTINAGTQPGWNLFLLKKPVLLPPGDYYLMLFTGGTAGVARNYATSTPNWIGIGANFASGPPTILDPPPANVSTGTVSLLMYGDLVVPLDEEYY